jgi:hypothetical protein
MLLEQIILIGISKFVYRKKNNTSDNTIRSWKPIALSRKSARTVRSKFMKYILTLIISLATSQAGLLSAQTIAEKSPTNSDSQKTGSIEGSLGFPSESIPAQKVCAQSIANPYLLNCIKIEKNQETYRLYVKPGDYFVFSSEVPIWGEGLTIYHTAGDAVTSSNPRPGTVVKVAPGQQVRGIDISNWFACQHPQFSRYCIWD